MDDTVLFPINNANAGIGDDDDLSDGSLTSEDDSTAEYGDEQDDSDSNSSNDGDSVVVCTGGTSISDLVAAAWIKRKEKVNSDYAITAWALSTIPAIREDVKVRLKGRHRLSIESTVKKLMIGKHRTKIEEAMKELYSHKGVVHTGMVTDTFWNEFKQWQNKTGVFSERCRWNAPDAANGNAHLWHEKYSLPYTAVLGAVACITTHWQRREGMEGCEAYQKGQGSTYGCCPATEAEYYLYYCSSRRSSNEGQGVGR
jgi:hypothetical protein